MEGSLGCVVTQATFKFRETDAKWSAITRFEHDKSDKDEKTEQIVGTKHPEGER